VKKEGLQKKSFKLIKVKLIMTAIAFFELFFDKRIPFLRKK